MSNKKKDKDKPTRIKSLCWICGRIKAGGGCEWVDEHKPVKGWAAEFNELNDTWCVVLCPKVTNDHKPLSADQIQDESMQDMIHAIISGEVDAYERALKHCTDIKRKMRIAEFKEDKTLYKRMRTKLDKARDELDSVGFWFMSDDAKALGVNNASQIIALARSRAFTREAVQALLAIKKRVYKDTAIRTAMKGEELDNEILQAAKEIDTRANFTAEDRDKLIHAAEMLLRIPEEDRAEVLRQVKFRLMK